MEFSLASFLVIGEWPEHLGENDGKAPEPIGSSTCLVALTFENDGFNLQQWEEPHPLNIRAQTKRY